MRSRRDLPVIFRFRPPRPVPFVDLRGDMTAWLAPTPMTPSGDGWYETSLRLEPGAYSYKFRDGDGEWHLDVSSSRTRSIDGVVNSLLVVAGADEPVLHAPAAPWLLLFDDGRLCLRAGLRQGFGASLSVIWNEGQGPHETPMWEVDEEDQHTLFEVHLPVSTRRFDYRFCLEDGRHVGLAGGAAQALQVDLDDLTPRTPPWWRDAVLYTVFVDRFRRPGGDWEQTQAPWGREVMAGGNLDGLLEALPYLANLGVDVLHLTPITVARSSHRYDVVEPRRVDPLLGGEDAFRRLLDAAHGLGLKLLFDITCTHVHRDFFAFQDVRKRGPASPYWGWFTIRRFPFGEGYEPGYDHYQKGQWQEPLLRTDNPEVVDWVVETFEHWARFGVDGFRIDAAADLPDELLRRVRSAVRAIDPNLVLVGEVVADNLHRFTDTLDAATDFVGQEGLYDWIWRRRIDATQLARVYARRRYGCGRAGYGAIAFTATHDQPRLLSLTQDLKRAQLAHFLILTRPEVPAIYYGDELGLFSEGATAFEDSWPDRQPMPWSAIASAVPGSERNPIGFRSLPVTEVARSEPPRVPALAMDVVDGNETFQLIRAAIRARRSSAALSYGDALPLTLETLAGDGRQLLAFRRAHRSDLVDVLVNGQEAPCAVALDDTAPSGARVLLELGEVEVNDGVVRLGPWSAVAVERHVPESVQQVWHELADHTQELAGAAFREGALTFAGLPLRLYLTVTEACNLRCQHCLTHAPQRTRSKQARRMRPWLLDALHDAFRAARYIGFSHGGESLFEPFFFDVLRAIQEARKGALEAADIHLLTNAMLLTPTTTQRLLDLGVTSLAISLDGASPSTQNVIRQGADFKTVIEHTRQALALRERTGLPLRVGFSTVLCAANLHEAESIGQLAVDLGVDWLKIEEMHPASPFARHQLIPPAALKQHPQVQALRDVVGGKLVLVEHIAAPSACRCQGNDATKAFRVADDFANSGHFDPCRMAWEQICVDPDGAVHLIDYDSPVVGELLDEPLLDIFHNEAVRRLRAAALGRMSEPLRRRCAGWGK